MEFEVSRVAFADKASTPKIEVTVRFTETGKRSFIQSGSVTVYLDSKDYMISELKAEAYKAAAEFLSTAVSAAANAPAE